MLTDRQAADRRASKVLGEAAGKINVALRSGGQQAMTFRTTLRESLRDVVPRVIAIYAEPDEASDPAAQTDLVTTIKAQVIALIQSSAKSVRGNDVAAVARESARLIASYGAGISSEFELAVHDAYKKKTLRPPIDRSTFNAHDLQYTILLELMQPVIRLLEWSDRYIMLLGDDAGVASRLARSSHREHFLSAGLDLQREWARNEPAILDTRVRSAFAEQRITSLMDGLSRLTDADRDEWDTAVQTMHDDAQRIDAAIRAALGDHQRGVHLAAPVLRVDPEHEFMAAAIEEARKSHHEPDKTPLFVGAVVVKDGKIVARGHRGQHKLGEHAEYTTLERNLPAPGAAANATLYCTLEPCIVRNHPKCPCAEWIKRHRIARVVIGVIDPNRRIRGGGVKLLRKAGIDVALFPHVFANEIEAMNSAFEREHDMLESAESGVPIATTSSSSNAHDQTIEATRVFDLLVKEGGGGFSLLHLGAELQMKPSVVRTLIEELYEAGKISLFALNDKDVVYRLDTAMSGPLTIGEEVWYREDGTNRRAQITRIVDEQTVDVAVYDAYGNVVHGVTEARRATNDADKLVESRWWRR